MIKSIVLLFLFLLPLESAAAVITSAGSGNWSSRTTWVGGVVPGDGDEAVIADGHEVRIDQNIGTAGRGLLMLRVGTTDGSTAKLIFDGANQPSGYKIIFASTGKVESGTGQNAYGIRFFGEVNLQGTADHPLTIEARVQDGSAYTFIQKDPNSSRVDLFLKQTRLRFLGDENKPAINAEGAQRTGEQVILVENRMEKSGFIQLAGVNGEGANLMVSNNVATDHKGPFIQFKGARKLTISDNQITLASFAPGGANGQAIIDSRQGERKGSMINIVGNRLLSRIDADDEASPSVYGIWLEGFTSSEISGNHISAEGIAYGYKEGISVFGAPGEAANILIDGNVVSGTVHGIGIHTADNPQIRIIRNRIFDNRNEHIYVSKGFQVRIANNIVYGFLHSGQAGILLYNTDQVQIVNNTLVGLQAPSVIGIGVGNKDVGVSTNVTIKNNILTHWEKAVANRPAGNSFETVGYNLFFSNGTNYDDDAGTTASQLPAARPGDVSGDPRYVNQASGDFHVQAGSAAIDKASALQAPDLDIDGQTRPSGGGIDIGADEFSKEAPKEPPPSCAKACEGGGAVSGGGAGGGGSPTVDGANSDEGGFGCGMVQSREKGTRRSVPGDLLFLAVPFFYWLFRKWARGDRSQGLPAGPSAQ